MSLLSRHLLVAPAVAAVLIFAQGCEASSTRAAGSAQTTANSSSSDSQASPFDKPGFVTGVKDGRLWVFRAGTDEAKAFLKDGKYPAKHAVRPAAGPAGMTIRSPEAADITAYIMAKEGFTVAEADGRFWIYRDGTDEQKAFAEKGKHPAKHAVRPGAGPGGATLRSPEAATINEYLATKSGFAAYADDGRLWIYQAGTEDHAKFMKSGKHPAKHVVRPGAGPGGITLRAVEADVLNAYLVHQDGFVTGIKDGRLWVFMAGSKEAEAFVAEGKYPAKHAVRPAGGPMGMTLRSPDMAIIAAYRRAAGLN